MKTSDELKAEIAKLTRELAEREFNESGWEEQYGSPFAAAEARSAEIGDSVSCELMAYQARLLNNQHPPGPCNCPKCDLPSALKRISQRSLQTIRGKIKISEPEHYCKKCRRSFFPSDAVDRS